MGGGVEISLGTQALQFQLYFFFFPEYYVVVTSQPCLEQPHHLYLPVKCMAGIKI